MSRPAPPIRFLAVAIGGWICIRAAFLGSEWMGTTVVPQPPVAAAAELKSEPDRPVDVASAAEPAGIASRSGWLKQFGPPAARSFKPITAAVHASDDASPMAAPAVAIRPAAAVAQAAPVPFAVPVAAAPSAPDRRWSGSAWLFVRQGDGRQLAPDGTLGGSQFGARLLYRLTKSDAMPISVSARIYSPLKRTREAEAAIGIEWQPLPHVPVRLLAERREAIGSDGRSAFAVMGYGGERFELSRGKAALDVYAQAGVVGIRSTDPFADGIARLTVPLGRAGLIRLGGGLWAAAQPGVNRLDAGPGVSVRIAPHLSVLADWRFRIAGDARPDSGPSLTLATDF